MRKLSFKFRPIPSIAGLLTLLLFVYLGQWQAGKAEKRMNEIAQHSTRTQLGSHTLKAELVETRQMQDMPIVVQGSYDSEHQFFVDNKQENGVPGLHVITPLKIENSETRVLINRGWIAWPQGRDVLPVVSTPSGVVSVHGLASVPSSKSFFLMPDRQDARSQLWTRLDIQRYASTYQHMVQPIVLLQTSTDPQDNLIRHWPPPEDRVAMHKSYALQWFSMAVALFLFYMYIGFKNSNTQASDERHTRTNEDKTQ